MKHPVIDYLLVSAACGINDKHNEKMLAEGRYIPFWKRHLLLTILFVMALPSILIGAFIIFANVVDPSPATVMVAMKVLLYGGIIGGGVAIFISFTRAEKRWKREANKPTKVVSVRKP